MAFFSRKNTGVFGKIGAGGGGRGASGKKVFRKKVTPIISNILEGFQDRVDTPGLLEQFGGTSQLSSLSLAGLEQFALGLPGTDESRASGLASNEAIQALLARGPQDVEDFVRSSIFDPGIAEAEDLSRFVRREGSVTGTRFGDTTTRAVGELFSDVNRQTNAARAAAVLQAQRDQDSTTLAASQLGLQAEGQALQNDALQVANLVQLASAGNSQAQFQVEQIARILGIEPTLLAQISDVLLSDQAGRQPIGGGFSGSQVAQSGANALASQVGANVGNQITGGSGSPSSGTGGTGSPGTTACWVAAEYYGWHTPDWYNARDWIMRGWEGRTADLFRFVYLKYGERLAKVVRHNKVVRTLLRPIFTWALRKGIENG